MSHYGIKDVKNLIGVSISTVSNILDKIRSVSKTTIDRVEKAVKEPNYQVDTFARSMKNNKNGVIDALKECHSLKDLLQIRAMAKNSYCNHAAAIRKDKHAHWKAEIRDIFRVDNRCYGYRRIYQHLKNSGKAVSEKVVRRLMHELGLQVSKAMIRKYNSYKVELTPAVENLVKRNLNASSPNELWLTDITEFHIPAGKVYFSPIIDCYAGMGVSWKIGIFPSSELANQMLLGALRTFVDEKPILYSDRGFHYRTNRWIETMDSSGLIRSIYKKACSADNSACEGFFGRLKDEMFYNRKWIGVSIEEFCNLLNEYIYWYNEKRIKMSLGGKSPLEYRWSLGLVS